MLDSEHRWLVQVSDRFWQMLIHRFQQFRHRILAQLWPNVLQSNIIALHWLCSKLLSSNNQQKYSLCKKT